MPFGRRADASRQQWRVLVVGPGTHAPQLLATLRTIDSNVAIDRAESTEVAERCLRSPVHYDAAFVLDTIVVGPDQELSDLVRRLSAGRTPPPLVAISTYPAPAQPLDLEPFIAVGLDARSLDLRQLIGATRASREHQRVDRLRRLVVALSDQLTPSEPPLVDGLQSAIDALIDAIDVQSARLTVAGIDQDLRLELSAGGELDITAVQGSFHSTLTSAPVMTIRRESSTFRATLDLGPLSAGSQSRIRIDLVAFLEVILGRIQHFADRRDADRAGILRQLFDESTTTAFAPPEWDSSEFRVRPSRATLDAALPALGAKAIEALSHGSLTLLHQPIMVTNGSITESDMRLGVSTQRPGTNVRSQLLDLSPLDALDTRATSAITAELTVPAGRWLMSTALPTLQRLRDNHDLDRDHRVHLGLLHRQLADTETVDLFVDLLQRHAINPRTLAIDVAEPTLLEHRDTLAAMWRLADIGVDLFLDGFGGAGSNFMLLRTSLVRGVRLSRQVIRNVSFDERQASIVSGLITMCDELDLDVIATGVDHRADLEWLLDYEHLKLQGDLVGPALTERELLGRGVAQAS